jgi:hypothetical protein
VLLSLEHIILCKRPITPFAPNNAQVLAKWLMSAKTLLQIPREVPL